MTDTMQEIADAILRVEALLLEPRPDPRIDDLTSRYAALEVRIKRLHRLIWRACAVAGVIGGVVGYVLAQV